MENESPVLTADQDHQPDQNVDQPGAQAVEALVRAIAQEFVLAFDEFHNSLLDEDETDRPPKVQAAGS
jgi:hypothetical protein